MSSSSVPPGLPLPPRHDLFGVDVSVTTYDGAIEVILALASAGGGGAVELLCVHGLMEARRDRSFREVLNGFDLVCPDGQPVRWALNTFHDAGLRDRVYGPELTWQLCGAAARAGVGVYLYGSRQEVIDALVNRLPEAHPGLKIVGAESPPFRPLSPQEDAEVTARINASGAGIVLLGTGCPKQETFAAAHRHTLRAVQVCVGAAFDLHAGVKSMAPNWMQRNGLEWAFRLWQEPRRLWRRYLVYNTAYVGLFAREWTRRRVLRRSVEGPPGVRPGATGASLLSKAA